MGNCTIIKNFFLRFWLNRCVILKRTCQWVGVIYSICGFLSVWLTFSDCLPKDWSFWCKLLLSIGVLLGILILCCVFVILKVLSVTKNIVMESSSGHKVYVQNRGMYSSSIVAEGYKERKNIVVSVNRCFDTII